MFKLEIATDNDAFGDNPGFEIIRILESLAKGLAEGDDLSGRLRDINGNTVGHYELIEEVTTA